MAGGAMVELVEGGAGARGGPGWAGLPRRSEPRWWIPREPRRASHAGLAVYQPVTGRTLLGWQLARCSTLTGAFQLLPRAEAPPRSVRHLLGPYVPPGGRYCVARANYPERFIAFLLDQSGSCTAVAKLAGDETGRACLSREARALSPFPCLISKPLKAPRILAQEEWLLILEAVDWRPRLHPP